MANDLALATEMQLMLEKEPMFNLVGDQLTHWRGILGDFRGYGAVELDILLPSGFPNDPPIIKPGTPMEHGMIKDGRLNPATIARWDSSKHLFEAIRDIRVAFNNVPPRRQGATPTHSAPPSAVTPSSFPPASSSVPSYVSEDEIQLEQQVGSLQSELARIEREITEITSNAVMESGSPQLRSSPEMGIKAELVAVEDVLLNLKDMFEDADIADISYLTLFRKYTTRQYLLTKKLKNKEQD